MKSSIHVPIMIVSFALVIDISYNSFGDALDRAAIAARQDQLQNLDIGCKEIRTYDIEPEVAAKAPPNFRQAPFDLKRTEVSHLNFRFLNGYASYDRETDGVTLQYWAAKGLPAIARQTLMVSSTGRIEELTTQLLANGKRVSFGGLRQLNAFAPDITIDIAMGLRLLGSRLWLNRDDLNAMDEIEQNDPTIVILRALDGSGHVHEMTFDKRLLYAMSYYRCTGTRGSYVEITNSDFHRYRNVFIPGRIVRNSNVIDSKGLMSHPMTFTMTVTSAALNDPNNSANRYATTWPANLKLFDARTNDEIDVGPTTRPLTDDDIREQLAERRTREVMFKELATQRIHRVLDDEPTTRP
jgi:hypothetical protein